VSERQLRLDQLTFPSYWPVGSPEVVREFLMTQYDPAVHPRLEVGLVDGEYHLLGWKQRPGKPGLLEAARGWALTDDEARWAKVWPEVAKIDWEAR
jgi:hypothetical protein